MTTVLVTCLSALLLHNGLVHAQKAPNWGEIECDMSITDRFPAGERYEGYNRWYTFKPLFPSPLRRTVVISTCIEDKDGSVAANVANPLYQTDSPLSTGISRPSADNLDNCGDNEIGYTYTFDLGDSFAGNNWEIGVSYSDSNNDYLGGRYKLSVQCLEPEKPDALFYKSTNVTQVRTASVDGSISCGVSVPLDVSTDILWLEYEVTDWAQQLLFTTCDTTGSDTRYYDSENNRYPGTTSSRHVLRLQYWDFELRTRLDGGWQTEVIGTSTSSCTNAFVSSDVYDQSEPTVTDVLRLSPGKYYVGVNVSTPAYDGTAVLTMLCWDNDAVALPGNTEWPTDAPTPEPTPYPTDPPTTSSPTMPTTAIPTRALGSPTEEPTPQPTMYPTTVLSQPWGAAGRTHLEGHLACGIYHHGSIKKRHSNYYLLTVLDTLTYTAFDLCMDDVTDFDAGIRLYRYDGPVGSTEWTYIDQDTSYCQSIERSSLSAGLYAVVVYGTDEDESAGDYIVRMNCGELEAENNAAKVMEVANTSAPTPAPVGIHDITIGKGGERAGDISCGLIVEGDVPARSRDFHKFEVIGGSVEWVRFSTCEETSFNNYLFVYEYDNHTGHEYYAWNLWENSIGFAYDDDTTCNELTMYNLPNGVYYVDIEGVNYYFDHGQYTIKMDCSDDSNVRAASSYNEYKTALAWYFYLLIAIGVVLFCACIVGLVCWCKKSKGGDGDGGAEEQTEMQPPPNNTEPGEFHQ